MVARSLWTSESRSKAPQILDPLDPESHEVSPPASVPIREVSHSDRGKAVWVKPRASLRLKNTMEMALRKGADRRTGTILRVLIIAVCRGGPVRPRGMQSTHTLRGLEQVDAVSGRRAAGSSGWAASEMSRMTSAPPSSAT